MTEVELERHLHDLYRGEDPPPGLAPGVFARARGRRGGRSWLRHHAPLVTVCAVVLAVCAFVAIGTVRQRQIEAQQAQQAQARLAYALAITTGELNWAESHIARDMSAGQRGGNQ